MTNDIQSISIDLKKKNKMDCFSFLAKILPPDFTLKDISDISDIVSSMKNNNILHFASIFRKCIAVKPDISKKVLKKVLISHLKHLGEWRFYSRFVSKEHDEYCGYNIDIEEGAIECGRCKSKKTISCCAQTRSADEGMTTYIKCAECNNIWKD